MSLDYELLSTIHRLLRQQAELAERIQRGPRMIKIAETTQARFSEELSVAKEALTRTRMLADEKQLQLDSREAKIEELKSKLNTCGSNREYQLLKDQIAADEQANLVLSDEILEQLEKIDVLTANVKQAEANLEKSVREKKRTADEVRSQQQQLQNELDRVTGERTAAETKFPGQVKAEYMRLVSANGELALASTDKQTCGNCSQHLTAQMANQLLLREAVFCHGCGSLLYVEEGAPAT